VGAENGDFNKANMKFMFGYEEDELKSEIETLKTDNKFDKAIWFLIGVLVGIFCGVFL
jgi:hypothetical protein